MLTAPAYEKESNPRTEVINILAKAAISSAKDFFVGVKDQTEEIAGYFRMGEEGQGSEKLILFIDDLQAISLLLSDLKLFAEASPLLIDDKRQIEENEKVFLDLLTQMLDAQSNNDWILLADLLEYEIVPLAGTLNDSLTELSDKL